METKAADMRDNIGISDKFRVGDRRQTIAAVEMRYNGYIRYGDK